MRKSLLASMVLLMLTSVAFAQTRTTLFYDPFRSTAADDGLYTTASQLNWGMQTGAGHVGDPSQWQLTPDLGFHVFTIGGGADISSGYEGASGGTLMEKRTWSGGGFAFGGINSAIYRDIWLSFGAKGDYSAFKISYSTDGGAKWIELAPAAGDITSVAGTNGWVLVTYKKSFPAVTDLSIKVEATGATTMLDDIRISGEKDAGVDLKAHLNEYRPVYEAAVEGLELGQYLSGSKAALKTLIDAADAVLAVANYENSAAKTADDNLVAGYTTFVAKKITATNAPKINQVADQPISFSNETKPIALSGIGASSGGGALTVTARSLNGKCTPTVSYTSGATATLNYTGAASFGKDRIIVTVEQANAASSITKKIEMSFAVEVADASVNIPPVIDAVATQYTYNNEGTKTVQLTGIDPINPGQTVTVTAASANTTVIPNPTVGTVSNGKATLTYTPAAGKEGKIKITLTVKDNGAGTTSGNGTTTLDFYVVVYDSANPPAMFDVPSGAQKVILNSGESVFFLSNMRNLSKIATGFKFEITQGAELIETPVIAYKTGDYYGLLKIKDKGVAGTVKMIVFLDDYPQEIIFNIQPFSNPGISLEIYDIVFWQQTNAVSANAVPVYSEVINDTRFPAQADAFWNGKWEGIYEKWTQGCTGGACQPAPYINLGTDGLKGFFIPKVTGNYKFSFAAGNDFNGGVWIDTTCTSWKQGKAVAINSNDSKKGTVSGTKVTSEDIYLVAGKVYPFYAVRWFVHHVGFDVKYIGPGIAEAYIPKELLAPIYDIEKPQAPTNLKTIAVKDKQIVVSWNAVSSGKKVAKVKGYNVYANGVKKNTNLVTQLQYEISELTPAATYNMFVTAVDELGNESLISNVETKTTYATGATAPGKVTTIKAVKKTGETLQVTWTKGAAPGSAIIAYDVYVDGVKYNTNDYIYTDTVLIRKLQPETSYKIEVVAYNASMVASAKSDSKDLLTAEFDPTSITGLEFGEYRVRLNVEKKNISWTEGVGINGDFKNGSLFSDQTFNKAITDMKPGIVRWGALDANMYGFEKVYGSGAGDLASSVGKTRKDAGRATHAMNMDYCNQIGSLYSLCVGTKNGPGGLGETSGDYRVDYINAAGVFDYQVFLNMIEYLAGPSTSTYGKIRAAEGFRDPVLDATKSKGVLIEFGNEVWGKAAHNSPIGNDYVKYGQSCRDVVDSIKKLSPYWDDIKDVIWFKYSARNPDPANSYGLNESVVKGHKGQVNVFGPGGYLGGDLEFNPDMEYGETIALYYRSCQTNKKKNLHGLLRNMQHQLQEGGSLLHTYFYETQVSTSSYFGKLGQAIVLGDYITSALKNGAITPAIFTYGGGEWRINIGTTPLAHYSIAQLINTYCKGHLVETTVDTNNTLLEKDNKTSVLDFDPVGTTVYNNGQNWSILLFSRDFANDYSVCLNLPSDIGTISNAKMFVVNEDTDKTATLGEEESGVNVMANFKRTESDITLKNGQVVYVPKHSAVLITFKANDPNFTKLPLGNFVYDKATGLSVQEVPGYPANITAKNGTARLTPIITPDNTFLTKDLYVKETNPNINYAKWEINPKDNSHLGESAVYPTMGMSDINFVVRATANTCNATFYVRASLASDPGITVLTPVTISGQATVCPEKGPAIDDAAAQVNFVYPNPAENVLYVKTEASDAMATINVYSATGSRVMAERGNDELFELNVSGLSAGIYYVTVEKGGKQETIPFIKK